MKRLKGNEEGRGRQEHEEGRERKMKQEDEEGR